MFISEGIVIVFLVFKNFFLLLIENGHDNVLIVSGQNTVHYVEGKKNLILRPNHQRADQLRRTLKVFLQS